MDTSILKKHARIGFQLSGGRDSVAALYALQGYWPLLTVYHLMTEEQFPETKAVVDKVEQEFGKITRIFSSVHANVVRFGLPSDLVPHASHDIGRYKDAPKILIQNRYDCCWRTVMRPLHERMVADQISLVVRGVRAGDYALQPYENGFKSECYQVWHPIEEWTDNEVDSYIEQHGLPVAPFYSEGLSTAPECMRCTAWSEDGRAAYLLKHHPRAAADYKVGLVSVLSAISDPLVKINEELERLA